ncbi:MAG: hypothetical protein NDI60_07150 [Elusimicrobiales bacterium]|nr:hypothetical protein [Elusimicrobiales bacterium]
MTRSSRESVFFYAFAGYMTVSLLSVVLLLLGALAGMKLLFAFAKLTLGAVEAYRYKPVFYDAAGFALASAGTAALHYYLASLLALSGLERRVLAAAVFSVAILSGLFFWRGALHSALGAYAFSGLPVTLAALIGGGAGLAQRSGENPWPFTASSLFR